MKPFQLASGGTLLTQSPKLRPSGLVDASSIQEVTNTPMLRGPSEGLISPKKPIQEIVVSSLPKAISDTTNVLVNEAFRYEDRMAQINADEATIAFRKKANELYNGQIGEDGKLEGGYSNTKNKDAMENLKGYRESMDALFNESVGTLSPSARAKAILRMSASKEDFVNQGVNHYQRETRNHEGNLLAQDEQLLQQEIDQTGAKPFLNGRVDEILNRYTDENKRSQAMSSLVKNAVYNVYNKAHAEASKNVQDLTPALTAHNKTVEFYNQIQEKVPVELDNAVYNWIDNQNDVAQRQAKAAETERKKELKFEIRKEAPARFGKALNEKDYDSLNADFQMYKSVHDDPEVASDNAMKALKESLYAVTQINGVTYKDKKVFLEDQGKKIFETVDLDPIETGKLMHIVRVELPKQIEEELNRSDQDVLNDQALRYAVVKNTKFTPGQVLTEEDMAKQPHGSPPADMLEDNKIKWFKLEEEYNRWATDASKGELSGHTPEKAQGLYTVYVDGLKDGSPLTDGQQDRMRMWLAEGVITPKQFGEALKLHKNVDTAAERVPAFKKTEEYKAVLTTVNEADAIFTGKPKPVPKSGKTRNMKQTEEYYEWVREAEIGKAQFRTELEKANKAAVDSGKPFSPHTFLRDWVKVKINSGAIATPPNQFMEFLGKEWMKGMEAPYRKSKVGTISGEQPSIMDDFEL